MFSQDSLESLIRSEKDLRHPALSIYLDVDQSKSRNRNREFEVALAGLLRPCERALADNEPELTLFRNSAARVDSFVKAYKPDAVSLVLFSDHASDLFWSQGLHVPIRERAVWGKGLFLRPLIEATDEYEAYLVVLADRERARLFLGYMGELEEFGGLFEPEVRRSKSVGTDHWRSQANFQRHATAHARSHVQSVVQALLQAERTQRFDRLIVAGGTAARSQVELALPARLRRKIAASVNLPVDASREEILEAVQKIQEEAERSEEIQIVEKLVTAASKGRRATVGLEKTLQAVARGQVHKLVYADDFRSDTDACMNCGAIQLDGDAGCSHCGEKPEPAAQLLDTVVNRVERSGGQIEVIKGNAADQLTQQNGGIGAFLRF